MNTRERFEKVRREQQNRFSLRTRLTVLVTIEMILCVLVAYCLDRLLNNVLSLGWKIPLEVELLCTCLLIGLLFTTHRQVICSAPAQTVGQQKVSIGTSLQRQKPVFQSLRQPISVFAAMYQSIPSAVQLFVPAQSKSPACAL